MSFLPQASFGFGAAAVLVATLWLPQFRDASGFPAAATCMGLAATASLVALAASLGGPLRRAGAWLALLILGQASALQLIDAGTTVHYQHYRPATGPLA